MSITNRVEIMPNVFLTYLNSSKFKAGCLSINILTKLEQSSAAMNAIIPQVLLRGAEKYPDLQSLAAAMDDIYGASIDPVVRKEGEVHCIGLQAEFVDDACLPENSRLLNKVAELMGEIILAPNFQNGLFRDDWVESEKKKLLDEIRSRINNKRTYAVSRLVELMCEGEAFSVFRLGSDAEAERITASDLTHHYNSLISTAQIEVFYCGSVDQKTVETALTEALAGLPRVEVEHGLECNVVMKPTSGVSHNFTEALQVTQGKLSLGFRVGEYMMVPNYAALMLFNYIYGGSVNSKLFLNVREKLSLCYYASSMVDKAKGLMMVASGIEFDKYDDACSEILAQLDAIRGGDISVEELFQARQTMITDLRMMSESPQQLEDFYLQQTILGVQTDLDELIGMAEVVRADEIIEIAKSMQLDAIYFLHGINSDKAVH